MDDLTHLDEHGHARMVDVGPKEVTDRVATAEALVSMSDNTRRAMFDGDLPKGDAAAVARIAAIQAVKKTPALIPLCHPLPVSGVEVRVGEHESGARVEVTVRTTARTGVEMEAMTGAAVAALTIYDMIKGIDRGAEIGPVRLLSKAGGSSGEWRR